MERMTFNKFIKNRLGKANDYDGAAGVQCVDLIKCYLHDVFEIEPGAWGDAHCYYDNFDDLPLLKSNFTRIEYTPGFVPQKGDIAVWKCSLNSGGHGHAAICSGKGDAEYFYSCDQNWGDKPCAEIKHNYEHLYGVLRPNDQTMLANRVADISTFQPDIDYVKLEKDFDGVIIRIGYRGYSAKGMLAEDNMFEKHVTGMINNHIPFGFYFFSQAVNETEAKEEADYAYSKIQQYEPPTYPVYIDIEYSSAGNQNGRADKLTERTDIALAFCRQMELHGVRAGVYASDSWFGTQLNINRLKDHSIWVAKYGTDNGTAQTKPKAAFYDGWQFTSQYVTSAYYQKIDCSYFYKDFEDNTKDGVDRSSKPSAPTPTAGPAEQPLITYTVKQGDTLTAIAKQYSTTVAKLVEDNGIKNANLIRVGQMIKIIK